jgi:hypothetical protein
MIRRARILALRRRRGDRQLRAIDTSVLAACVERETAFSRHALPELCTSLSPHRQERAQGRPGAEAVEQQILDLDRKVLRLARNNPFFNCHPLRAISDRREATASNSTASLTSRYLRWFPDDLSFRVNRDYAGQADISVRSTMLWRRQSAGTRVSCD